MTQTDPAKVLATLAALAQNGGRGTAVHLLYDGRSLSGDTCTGGTVTPVLLHLADELWNLGQTPADTLHALADAAALIPNIIAESVPAPGRLIGAAYTHPGHDPRRAAPGRARVAWAIDQHGTTYFAETGGHGLGVRSWPCGSTGQGDAGVLDALAAITARLASATRLPRGRTAPVASAAPALTP